MRIFYLVAILFVLGGCSTFQAVKVCVGAEVEKTVDQPPGEPRVKPL